VTRWRLPVAALTAALVLAAGCESGPEATTARSAAPGASGAPASAPPNTSPSGSARDITLAVAGDVHFMGRTAKLLDDPAHAFGSIVTVLNATDLTVLNLETAITDRGTAQSKEFHFRAPPAAFDALRAAGVDAVTFANNHVLDYGQVGLADTLAAANAAQFPYFGIGVNAAAAWAPLVRTVGGTRLAFIGVSQVHELASAWVATDTRPGQANAIDENRTLAAIRSAKTSADIVIVFMHWGTEGNGCPNPEQKALAKKMAAAGANIILGAHAHTLQGSGWLGHTFVAYGMANFLWYSTSYSTQTGVLRLTLHRAGGAGAPVTAQFLPAVVSGTGQPVLLAGADKARAERSYDNLRGCAGLTADPT
jgi:poly-gamma-glutamate capsule biosynthesis protein CapA/YwtB (metallophosphatase superfamily)